MENAGIPKDCELCTPSMEDLPEEDPHQGAVNIIFPENDDLFVTFPDDDIDLYVPLPEEEQEDWGDAALQSATQDIGQLAPVQLQLRRLGGAPQQARRGVGRVSGRGSIRGNSVGATRGIGRGLTITTTVEMRLIRLSTFT